MRVFPFLIALLAVVTGCKSLDRPATADLVLHNGRIATVDDSLGEVQALAVQDGRILAVGSSAAILSHVGPDTEVIDLEGRRAIPGFIEGHGHFAGIGNSKLQLDLMTVRSWDEVIAQVAAAVQTAQPGEWILGRGWHQEKWDSAPSPSVKGFPTHAALSAASPNNPVRLTHASGHASFFNAKAMELAGVDRDTPDPPGGEIVKGPDGAPTGIFNETAQWLVGRVAAEQQEESPEEARLQLRKRFALADAECLSNGVTSFQDAGSSFAMVDALREMADAGELGVRLWVMLRASNEELAERLADYRQIGTGDEHLTVRAVKRWIDGALGSRGAWLLEPYSDLPGSTGLNTSTVESVTETARLCLENGFQLCVHAIGDRANREVLDVYQRSFEAAPEEASLRWRVEHAQHLNPLDIPRFFELGVIASMQGVHCTSDAPYVPARLGDRRAEEGAYVWRKLMDSGAVVSNGTDAPVEDVSPIASYYATVSRMLPDGTRFYPDQRLGRLDALETYTLNCAYAAFEEDLKGSLTPGKLADIVVLDTDILTCPEADIPATKVDYTIVGGRILFEG